MIKLFLNIDNTVVNHLTRPMEKDYFSLIWIWKMFRRNRNQTAAHAQKGVKCPLTSTLLGHGLGLLFTKPYRCFSLGEFWIPQFVQSHLASGTLLLLCTRFELSCALTFCHVWMSDTTPRDPGWGGCCPRLSDWWAVQWSCHKQRWLFL